jgi:hypothetical protein
MDKETPIEIDVAIEIKKIFDNNKLIDLKRFLSSRKKLNKCNSFYIYLFYIVQSLSTFTIAIASGYDIKYLNFIGLGLQMLATLIIAYEKINNNMLKVLLNNIKNINNGTYIDEDQLVELDMYGKNNYQTFGVRAVRPINTTNPEGSDIFPTTNPVDSNTTGRNPIDSNPPTNPIGPNPPTNSTGTGPVGLGMGQKFISNSAGFERFPTITHTGRNESARVGLPSINTSNLTGNISDIKNKKVGAPLQGQGAEIPLVPMQLEHMTKLLNENSRKRDVDV